MPVGSDTEELEFQVDEGRFFVENTTLSLRFRLRVRRSDLRQVCIEARCDAAGLVPAQTRHFDLLKPGVEREDATLCVIPSGMRGEIVFRWRVSYRVGEEFSSFESPPVAYAVYPAGESVQRVMDQLTINVQAQAGHAGDARVSMGDGLQEFSQAIRERTPRTIREMLDDIRRLPPSWRELPLYACDAAAPVAAPSGGPGLPAIRLTLEMDGKRLHLLGGEVISLGRHRQCDLVTRLYEEDRKASSVRNTLLSRAHCRLLFACGGWRLADGGSCDQAIPPQPSSAGTFLDGRPLGPLGERLLPVARPFQITLGGAGPADPRVFMLQGWVLPVAQAMGEPCDTCRGCRRGDPACLLLHRGDTVPESAVLLYRCLDLDRVWPEFHGVRLICQGCTVQWRWGASGGALEPNTEVRWCGRSLHVTPLRRIGLED